MTFEWGAGDCALQVRGQIFQRAAAAALVKDLGKSLKKRENGLLEDLFDERFDLIGGEPLHAHPHTEQISDCALIAIQAKINDVRGRLAVSRRGGQRERPGSAKREEWEPDLLR